MSVLSQRNLLVALCVFAVLPAGCGGPDEADLSGQTEAELKPKGSAYVYDDFEDATHSERIWYDGSCSPEPYSAATLGTTLRKGACVFRTDADGNRYKRFYTRPFDTRAASVDWRKGGAEMRPRLRPSTAGFDRTYYGLLSATTGWDPAGEFYLVDGNRVRYSWDFRVVDDSMIANGFARSAVLGQFHGGEVTTNRAGQRVDCGEYNPSLSPSPGLMYETFVESATGRKKSHFTLFVKVLPQDISQVRFPVPADACPAGATVCVVKLWEGIYDYAAIKGQWLSLSYFLTLSPTSAGRIEYFFGLKDSTSPSLVYQRRKLSSAQLGAVPFPTKENACPANIFLGMYVLGYPEKYYGTKAERDAHGAGWVDPDFTAQLAALGGGTPSVVVDYDNFRIVQE